MYNKVTFLMFVEQSPAAVERDVNQVLALIEKQKRSVASISHQLASDAITGRMYTTVLISHYSLEM